MDKTITIQFTVLDNTPCHLIGSKFNEEIEKAILPLINPDGKSIPEMEFGLRIFVGVGFGCKLVESHLGQGLALANMLYPDIIKEVCHLSPEKTEENPEQNQIQKERDPSK